MDDLIITLFMADTGVEDRAVAESLLLRFGLAEHYIPLAVKLMPYAEEAYAEAAIDGAMAIHDTVVAMRFDQSVIPNAEFGRGVEFAMNTVHTVIDRVINLMENEGEDPAPVEAEADPVGAFEAIFGVAPSR